MNLGDPPFPDSTVSDFWIGGTTLIDPPKWLWTDGTLFNYTAWSPSEPKNLTGEACAAMSIADGTWSAQECFKLKPSVCKVDKGAGPPFVHCPFGWIYFQPSDSCYGMSGYAGQTAPLQTNWTSAELQCQAYGGHLPSIHSQEEIDAINGIKSKFTK